METEQYLLEYIKSKKYFCYLCDELKKKVLEEGLSAIDEYKGMICGGITDMQLRKSEIK